MSAPFKKLLILGAGGFLGSSVALAVRLALPKIVTVRPTSNELDLSAPDAGSRLGAMVDDHTAVLVCAGRQKRPSDTIGSLIPNVAIACAVAEAMLLAGPERVVFLSSGAVFGDGQLGEVDEVTEPNPTTWYGIAKQASERILINAARMRPGTKLTIVRPSVVYGPSDNNGYTPSGFMLALLRGEMLTLWGDGEETRDFIYVKDFVAIMLRVLFHTSPPALLHACGGGAASYRECANICAELTASRSCEFRPRTRPFIHQIMCSRVMAEIFPEFRATPLSEGLKAAYEDMIAPRQSLPKT